MPQVIDDDLRRYMICCATGQTLEPPKYLFYRVLGFDPTNRTMMEAEYSSGEFDSTIIESHFLIPDPSMRFVFIWYIENTVVIKDNIWVDCTSSTSFWTDINGWLQMNNYNEITYNALLNKWFINDQTGRTMMMILLD